MENYEKTPYGALTLIKTGPWMLRSELAHLDPYARSNAVARIDDDAGVNSLAKGQRSACVVHDDNGTSAMPISTSRSAVVAMKICRSLPVMMG